MITGFKLSEKEAKAAEKFIKKQMKKETIYDGGAIGGRFSYVFTIMSIGNSVEVVDNVLNEKKDVTDMDSW